MTSISGVSSERLVFKPNADLNRAFYTTCQLQYEMTSSSAVAKAIGGYDAFCTYNNWNFTVETSCCIGILNNLFSKLI